MNSMPQDFSRKMSIVLRENLASWQLTNTVSHISAFLGNKLDQPFDTGKFFASEDGVNFPRNSQYGIVSLQASKEEIMNLTTKLSDSGLLWIAYTQDMIDLIDDEELIRTIGQKNSNDLDILGIGIFGTKEELKELTGKFKLWK